MGFPESPPKITELDLEYIESLFVSSLSMHREHAMSLLLRCGVFSSCLAMVSVEHLAAAPFVAARDAQCVAYSPDGKLVATGISGMSNEEFPPLPHPSPRKCGVIGVFNVETGERLKRLETFGDLTRLRFSADGRWLACSRLFATAEGVSLNSVGLIDVATGEWLQSFDRCHGFDFAPDSKAIAVLSRTKCMLFDTATRERIHEIAPLRKAITIQYAPDGKSIAGIVPKDDKFAIVLAGIERESIAAESVELDDPFYSLTFSMDGTLLATGHPQGNVILWQAANLKPIGKLNVGNKELQQPFFSPDGEVLGSGSQENGDVVFWHVATSKELRRYTFQQGTFRTYYRRGADDLIRPEVCPERFVFSPDGNSFLAGCYGGMIRQLSDGRDIKRFGD